MNKYVKYIIDVWFIAGMCVISGCTTGGLVIGPFSNMAAQSNERAMMTRSVMASTRIEPAKKEQAIRAMNMCGDAGAVVVGLSLDVTALVDNQYTMKELFKSAIGAIGDTLLYGGAIVGAGKIADSMNNSRSGTADITINGDVHNSSVSTIQGNSSPVSLSQTTANRTSTEAGR